MVRLDLVKDTQETEGVGIAPQLQLDDLSVLSMGDDGVRCLVKAVGPVAWLVGGFDGDDIGRASVTLVCDSCRVCLHI